MLDPARARRGAALGAVLALWGVWISHTLEHLRVLGAAGLASEFTSPAHAYMVPAVAVLAALAAVAGARLASTLADLAHRLDRARAALAGVWRGRSPAIVTGHLDARRGRRSDGDRSRARATATSDARPTATSEAAVLVAALVLVQLLPYLVQENLELALCGRAGPWWTPLTGVHWLAPLVHVAVAAALVLATTPLRRCARRLAERVLRCERLLASAARRLGRLGCRPTRPRRHAAPPFETFGTQLWSRPPPRPLPC